MQRFALDIVFVKMSLCYSFITCQARAYLWVLYRSSTRNMCTPPGWYAGPSLFSFQVAVYTYTWVRRSTQHSDPDRIQYEIAPYCQFRKYFTLCNGLVNS